MSKFKKGDWIRESDADPGDQMDVHGYYVYDVLPDGSYVLEVHPDDYRVHTESYLCDCVVEPRCTGWDWVLPEPSNRFGLKVGDKVVVKAWDGRLHSVEFDGREYTVGGFEEGFSDGIARVRIGTGLCFHPYWFGLCQSDGSPLPPKPETYTMYEYVGMRSVPVDGGYVELLHHPYLTKSPSSGRPIVATGRVFEIPKGEKP